MVGTMIPGALNRKVQNAIYEGTVTKPAEKNYTHWQKDNRAEHGPFGAEVYLKYYWFNITNPSAVMNGAAPVAVKLGPYVFRKFVTEGQVQYFDSDDGALRWRASRKLGELKFEKTRSVGSLDDVIYTPDTIKAWYWPQCTGTIMDDSTAKKAMWDGDIKHLCMNIAEEGIFWKGSVGELIYGTRMGSLGGYKSTGGVSSGKPGIPFRYNNGHTVCPSTVETCRDSFMVGQYNPNSGDCSEPKKCGGQFSNNWSAKRMREPVTMTGYENEGCRRPLENQGCFTQKACEDPWDPEDEDHSTICDRGKFVAITRPNTGTNSDDARFDFLNHKRWPPLDYETHTGFDYTKWDSAKRKKFFNNVIQWYDDTPYDTSDDLAVETSFAQDGGHPCKWDGSTNGKTGCPNFNKGGYGQFNQIAQGMLYPPRQRKADYTVYEAIYTFRPMDLKFKGVETIHETSVHKYKPDPAFFAADGANKKYGMDSSGNFAQFPGPASFPVGRQHMGVPMIWTLPHWHRGGDIADRWNEAIGARKSREKADDWAFWYEPITGAPIDMNFGIQMNLPWAQHGGCLIKNATDQTTRFDFSNLDLSAHGLGTVDLTKMGNWMSAVDTGRCTGSSGCHSMYPVWQMKLQIEFPTHVASKIRNLVFGLKKLAGLQSNLGQLMIFGVCLIIGTFGCNVWVVYGPEEDKSSAMKAAA